MIIEDNIRNLTGKILLSTTSVSNDYLSKIMIYICSHNMNGAMGIAINKQIPDMSIIKLLTSLKIDTLNVTDMDIYFGGPSEVGNSYILHSDDYLLESSSLISDHIALTSNLDIIKVFSTSKLTKRPVNRLMCMGCFLWEAEQLEMEVSSNYWIPIAADDALIFGNSKADKWSKAFFKIGSQTNIISNSFGNA